MDSLIRVVVADDEAVIGAGVAALLGQEPDIEVLAAVSDPEAALAVVRREQPTVLLTDILYRGAPSGFELADAAAHVSPATAVLLLSSFAYPAFASRALEVRAAGYLVKGTSPAALLTAIRVVAGGGTSYTALLLRAAKSAPRRPSEREAEVIGLLAEGASNEQIGGMLGITPKTVESHLRRLFVRYGVGGRTELVVRALAEGWVAAPIA